ncbi:hypothetical protein [Flavobacterium selenitireducens]|uniref:hypothetical protein n=1 Tax=Flavobacterium selenitireducens TaxID=2722704 RepID=UPI00168B9BF7|nr:hypothetical protein [Flavobacterium selenitireducens]MBD3581549.1 hypothetical protein [Flavobacterium selenitireducens]
MNSKKFKVSILAFVSIFTMSCSSDDSSSSTETITEETSQTNTWVKLTATTSAGVNKPNYIIMMFDQPVTSTNDLPPIKKQITTDANGLAYFDLNSMITSTTPTKYYFEAFVQNGTGYIWKSVSHYNVNLSKGTMATSSIIVN